MKLGGVLKACRQKAGLSQEELADKLYINQSDVSKYENDVKEAPASILQAWMVNTQSAEVMVAFLYGIDGLKIIESVLQMTMVTFRLVA